MEKEAEVKVVLPPVSQIGIVVKDIEKTAEYYTSMFGIGPFTVYDTGLPGAVSYGKPAPVKMKIALAQTGLIEIELIQPLEGGELYTEFLRNKGEGLHHLGIHVGDFETYDGLLAKLGNQGIKSPLSYRGRRLAFAYLDTQVIGGVILELIHLEGRG